MGDHLQRGADLLCYSVAVAGVARDLELFATRKVPTSLEEVDRYNSVERSM